MIRKYLKVIVLLVVSTGFSACLKERNPLVGSWEYVSVNIDNNTEIPDEFTHFQSIVTFSSEGTFLFTDDGSRSVFDALNYTYDGRTYFGTWQEEGAEITLNILNYVPNRIYQSEITFNDGKNLKLKLPISQQKENPDAIPIIKYKRSDYDDLGSLLSLEKNQWRIKSYQKNTREEIKKRIEASLKFAIEFLEYHEKEEKFAKTYYVKPSPLKLYGNGVVLKYCEDCEDWNELFYDKEDAEIAYRMLKESFDSVAKIPEEISKNPIKINIFILKETLKNFIDLN